MRKAQRPKYPRKAQRPKYPNTRKAQRPKYPNTRKAQRPKYPRKAQRPKYPRKAQRPKQSNHELGLGIQKKREKEHMRIQYRTGRCVFVVGKWNDKQERYVLYVVIK